MYDIDDFATTYAEYTNYVNPSIIRKVTMSSSGEFSYEFIGPVQGKYPLKADGTAYWIYSEKDLSLPIYPISK